MLKFYVHIGGANMTIDRAIEIISNEKKCVERVGCDDALCDRERQCSKCDLAMESEEIIEAYKLAIKVMDRYKKITGELLSIFDYV